MSHPNKKLPSFPLTSKPSLIFLLLCLLPPRIDAFYFNFPSFASNQTYIKIEGDAQFKGGSINLNLMKRDSVGRALYRDPVRLWEVKGSKKVRADFNTNFSFQISKGKDPSGEGHGLAFALVGENGSWSETSFGGLLGLFESEVAALTELKTNQVVAVEFDTFQNDWDPSTFHIGIDVNSIRSKKYTNVTGGFIDEGVANVRVVYNATTMNLSASFTLSADSSTSYDTYYVVDLSDQLPQRVRVGFTAATRTYTEIHQVQSWSFESRIEESFDTPPSSPQYPPISPEYPQSPSPGRKMTGLVVGVTASLVAVILISGVFLYLFRSRRNIRDRTPLVENPGPKRFSHLVLSKATNNFNKKLKLGEGGFGHIYEGKLADSNGEVVAVKRFKGGSSQGEKEYVSEVNIISTLKHKNVVQLKGWCHEKGELILVYEFMPNRSLDLHIFGKISPPLTWPKRYKIITDLASVLQYLQDGNDPFVLHRDIKSSNIMLDSEFNAKLGDFGLARVTPQDQSLKTTVPAGTLGYLAPEVLISGKVSKASDIYSFGVVALEIASGRSVNQNNKEDPSLVEWVWDLYGKRSILEAVDVKLNGEFDEDQARRLMVVGIWCCHPDLDHRPSIRQVQSALNFEATEPNLPPKIPRPTYVSYTGSASLLSSIASMETTEEGR